MSIFVSLLIFMIVAGLGWWAFTTILQSVPLPAPVKAIFTVISVLLICGFLLNGLGYINLGGSGNLFGGRPAVQLR